MCAGFVEIQRPSEIQCVGKLVYSIQMVLNDINIQMCFVLVNVSSLFHPNFAQKGSVGHLGGSPLFSCFWDAGSLFVG